MTRKEIKDAIIEEIREIDSNIPLDEEIDEKQSPEELGMDSLDCVELVMKLEGRFSIAMPDDDIENMKTDPIEKFINYLVPILE